MPPPLTSGFGSSTATTTRAMPASATTRRARAGAPDVGARLERAVQRRAARALAGVAQREDFGVRPAGELVRAAADDHALASTTTTAPTIGLGLVRPRPRSASASARA